MPQLGVSPQTLKAETHLQPCARNDIFPAFFTSVTKSSTWPARGETSFFIIA